MIGWCSRWLGAITYHIATHAASGISAMAKETVNQPILHCDHIATAFVSE